MKYQKTIIILTIIVCFCVAGYTVSANSIHYNYEEEHIENTRNTDEYDEQEGHDEEEDHEDHEESEQVIELTSEQVQQIGLETALAGPGTIDIYKKISGQISINRDKITYVVPRVEGIVTKVNKQLGDKVVTDEIVAVIESRELTAAKAEYLEACAQYEIAEKIFTREENLWNEKISSEQDYLESKQALTQAGIEKQVAEYNLQAIGFDKSYIENLINEPQQLITQFEIKTLSEGIIIEKNIVQGELVGIESIVFVVADLSTVWIDLQIYPRDLAYIKKGHKVVISSDSGAPDANGVISYLSPILTEESKTAMARVVIPNQSGMFRPGLFVTAQVAVSQTQANIVVPKDSIQTLDGEKCVFIKDEHGFEPVFIEIGHESTTHAEVRLGLAPGQEYVTKGAFALKSQIVTSTLDSHAGHGH